MWIVIGTARKLENDELVI
jgi:hypothetical protein